MDIFLLPRTLFHTFHTKCIYSYYCPPILRYSNLLGPPAVQWRNLALANIPVASPFPLPASSPRRIGAIMHALSYWLRRTPSFVCFFVYTLTYGKYETDNQQTIRCKCAKNFPTGWRVWGLVERKAFAFLCPFRGPIQCGAVQCWRVCFLQFSATKCWENWLIDCGVHVGTGNMSGRMLFGCSYREK